MSPYTCANRATICLVHIRFRAGLAAQDQPLSELPFTALWYPYGTYLALAANIFLIFFQGYPAFLNPFSAKDFVINYILLPVFLILLLGYKLWRKTKWVKAAEMDIWTGRRTDLDANKRNDVEELGTGKVRKQPKTWMKKVKNVVVG